MTQKHECAILSTENCTLTFMNQKQLRKLFRECRRLKLENNFFQLPMRVNFQINVQFENIEESMLSGLHDLLEYENWKLSRVPEYSNAENGFSILTNFASDKKEYWRNLNYALKFSKGMGATITDDEIGSITFKSNTLDTKESLINFLKIWIAYQDIIYRFAFGEYSTQNRQTALYAAPENSLFRKIIEESYSSREELVEKLKSLPTGVNGLDFSQLESNEEIRITCLNSSLDPVIWENTTYFFEKLLLYCKSREFNTYFIDRKIDGSKKEACEQYKPGTILKYNPYNEVSKLNKIDVSKAFELADLIFGNKLEKLYFLKQYLKDKRRICGKSKKFIKTNLT